MTTATGLSSGIADSLQRLADIVGDPNALIYARLFERAPELEDLFVLDTDGSVRGEMLYRAFELIDALSGNQGVADDMVVTELRNHIGYGVPIDQFTLFFRVIAEVCAQALGAQWTSVHEQAWGDIQTRVDQLVRDTEAY